jgi:transposase
MSINMIGLDNAKSVFQIHAVDQTGKMEIRRKLRRSELLAFFEQQEPCRVVLEACGAAHHWARMLTGLGHDLKLIAPEAVRPFVKKGKKNDAADAAALCTAASRPDVKFVPAKRAWSSRASSPCIRSEPCWSSSRRCWRTPFAAWRLSSA